MGNFIVNETNREVMLTRTKTYKVPANSIVEIDLLAGKLGTDYNDIEASIEKQYPDLRMLNAMYLITECKEAKEKWWDDEWGD